MLCHTWCISEGSRGGAVSVCCRCSVLALGGARASPFRSAPGFDVSSVFFCTSCFLRDCFEPAVPSESWSVGFVKRGNGVNVRDRRRCVWLWVKPELLSLSAMQFSPTNGDFTFVSSTDAEGTVVKGPKASTRLLSHKLICFMIECSWFCLRVWCTRTIIWEYIQVCERSLFITTWVLFCRLNRDAIESCIYLKQTLIYQSSAAPSMHRISH